MSHKHIVNRIGNWALTLTAVWLVATLGWRWLHQDPRVGSDALVFEAQTLDGVKISLPPKDGKPSILIFWATWCGPCRMELARIQSAITDGELDPERVIAISSHEPLEVVNSFARAHGYTFRVIADPEGTGAALFRVRVTPTVIHLDRNMLIAWVAEGVHPLSISRAKDHLRPL